MDEDFELRDCIVLHRISRESRLFVPLNRQSLSEQVFLYTELKNYL